MKCDKETESGACEKLTLERLRYFTGRHMTARDFSDADAYHRTMRHLHNRVLHGTGVACGLEVTTHARPECGVVIRCGLAIDCCGREVVLPRTVALRIDWDAWPKSADGVQREGGYVLLLCLEYCELLTEKVPVLYNANACASACYEDGRIREGYLLRWRAVKEEDLPSYGWHTPKGCAPGDEDPHGSEPCDDDPAAPCCIEPRCPPCHCVALAIVRGSEERPEVTTDGRPTLAHSRDQLTHICWISWPHGGVVKLGDFHELRVRFDRALADPHFKIQPGPRGVNERTFWAQYGQQREDLDFVMFTHPPHLLKDRRTAVFEVLRPQEYRNQTIHVTLRCDFIVDCHGNPVDGDHLRGRLPSGNGIAGGTFESWFQVVDDDEYDRLMQPGAPGNSTGATP